MTLKRTKAFTLVEVMFAVITLGIGLIMVAAIFPVAIQQRKLASEETTAAGSGASGMQVLGDLGKQGAALAFPVTGNPSAPYTGTVQPLPPNLWDAVRGNLILASDPRMAWVPLYRRDGSGTDGVADTAQVFVIGVQVRNTTVFDQAKDTVRLGTSPVAPFANLQPRAGRVIIDRIPNNAAGSTDPYYADFRPMAASSNTTIQNNVNAIAEGMFIIITSDEIFTPAENIGRMNGRIYRLGAQRTDIDASGLVYELAPGWDFKPDAGADGILRNSFGGTSTTSTDDIVNIGGQDITPSATDTGTPADGAGCWFVGRGFADPGTPGDPPVFSGPAMDVAVYTGFIPLAN
jgi:type II secretory pathway pseudopilin PulG